MLPRYLSGASKSAKPIESGYRDIIGGLKWRKEEKSAYIERLAPTHPVLWEPITSRGGNFTVT
jgi:hypothetical protein